MTRKLALLCLTATLAFTSCDRIKNAKIPFLNRKQAPEQVAEAIAPGTPEAAAAATAEASAPGAAPTQSAPGTPAAAPAAAAPKGPQVNTNAAVVVLCYHRFEDLPKDSLAIKPSEFEQQLQQIKDNGFTVIKMQDFLAWRRGEKEIPEKSCIITIDDGYRSGYDVAWPILKKFDYPFTMFVYVNYIGSGGKSVTWDQLAEMRDAGVDIQSHTYSHSNLKAPGAGVDARTKGLVQKDIQELGKEGWLRKEIAGSRKELEEKLGIRVNALAYPFGIHSPEARAMVLESGYEAGFTVYGQRVGHAGDSAQIGRYAIDSKNPKIFVDAMKMIGGGGGGGTTEAPAVAQIAAASMVTQPMEGETIKDPKPVLKANLATMGEVDPGSVEIRVSGIGPVPAKYDPATKMVTGQVTQKLRDKDYTVILSAKANGKKVEARWSFKFDPAGAAPAAEQALPKRP
jgi:peptidoglycan/xylan/chitin deacetylase (PgdA/CDA1 family)